MTALIITIIVTLGINIYQAINFSKLKGINKGLWQELQDYVNKDKLNNTVITRLSNKLSSLESKQSEDDTPEKVTVKKTRTKK